MESDAFDVYPCMVDSAPASIYVNLRYRGAAPPTGLDTRISIVFGLNTPGPHGIGTAEEAETLDALERSLIDTLGRHGLIYVGRVRNRGEWESVFYGPSSGVGVAREATAALGRGHEVRHEADGTWRYYDELLAPDDERLRWMDDRRLVQILGERGDRLVNPRPVEHALSFPSAATRVAFVADIQHAGFREVTMVDSEDGFVVHVERDDAIELDHIHDVVMLLVDKAYRHGGTYLRWTSAITI